MKKVKPCLFYSGTGAEAMKTYKSIFKKNFKIERTQKSKGAVLCYFFKLFDQEFMAINDPYKFKFTPAFSISVTTKDQAETDIYWKKLIAGGGRASYCGWLQDKFGLSWQITPKALGDLMESGTKKQSEAVFGAMCKMGKIDIAELKRAYHNAK